MGKIDFKMIGQAPRRRIPIDKEREKRANQKKIQDSRSHLINVIYGYQDQNAKIKQNQNKLTDKNDLNQMIVSNNKDTTINIIDGSQKQAMIPLSARFSSDLTALKPTIQSELIKLKYPQDSCVYEDDPIVPMIIKQRARPPRELSALTPLELKNQMIPPKLVIPKSNPNNTGKLTKTSHSAMIREPPNTSRPIRHKLIAETQEEEDFDDAKELLYLYDDSNFDIGIIEKAKELLRENGYLDGYSLFCNRPDFTTDWHPCRIIKISENGEMLTMTFNNETEKEVHRISVRFAFENESRFQRRRGIARKARKEMDMDMRIQSKIMKISEKIKTPSNPTLLTNSLQHLNHTDQKSTLVNECITEISHSFILAEARVQYMLDWADPFKRSELKKENLGQTKIYQPNLNLPGALKKSQINCIDLPNYKISLDIIDFLMDFDNRDVLKEMFETVDSPIELRKFFEEIHFNMKTMISFSQGQLYRKLYNLTYDMVENKSKKKAEQIMNMSDCRLATALSTKITSILTNFSAYMVDNHQLFKVYSNELLTKVKPSLDDFLNQGKIEIEKIYNTFNTNPVNKIQEEEIDHPNVIQTEQMDIAYKICIDKWTSFFTKDFEELYKLFEELNTISLEIPSNPFEKLIDVLPRDFYTVLMKNEKPIVYPEEILFQNIYETLSKATQAIKKLNTCYKPVVTFRFIVADLNMFFDLMNNRFNEFQTYIFRYLKAYGDYQLQDFLDLIMSLQSKMQISSTTVEKWHDKKLLIENIKKNFGQMNESLNFEITLIEFLQQFLYEPEQNYEKVYAAKIKLHKFYNSISFYENQLENEKDNVVISHSDKKELLTMSFDELLTQIFEYHMKTINDNPILKVAENLDKIKNEFEELKKKRILHQQLDNFLETDVLEYPKMQEIDFNLQIFEPIWNISRHHLVLVEQWLSTNFVEVNVTEITETIQKWIESLEEVSKTLNSIKTSENEYLIHIKDYLSENGHDESPLLASIHEINEKNRKILGHIPILRELSNPTLRARHWNKISEVIKLQLEPNEGATWYWLIESGIENHLLLISSISRSARNEYQIEKALHQMCNDLRSFTLKTKTVNGINKIEDPTYAFEMLGSHRQIMQELFIPPYVQPFLAKIADYEILVNNLREVLKQTLEAQSKIDELAPAIDSDDFKAQAPELQKSFKEKISSFNNLTKNFKMNISFHQIVANQTFLEMSRELNLGLESVKEDMKKVLEKKRQIFPRFRFLSDSQLVSIISHARQPSVTKELFSLMYPAIKESVIEDEQFCTGFCSFDGEIFTFREKIWVNPHCVEKWHLQFDEQIILTMKHDLRKLIDQQLTDIYKFSNIYPCQTLLLYLNILFTSKVNKVYSTIESLIDKRKETTFEEMFANLLNNINNHITCLEASLEHNCKPQTSNLLLALAKMKDIVHQILNEKLMTATSLWTSFTKYYVDSQLNVTVSIGNAVFNYGFDYIGFSSLPLYGNNEHIFNSIALLAGSGFTPLICGPREIRKTNLIIDFAHMIGKQPFVFSCVSHSSFDRIHQMAENVQKINSFLIIKDLFLLAPTVLNQVNVMLTNNNRNGDFSIFATTSAESYISEKYRIAFRPILIQNVDILYCLKSIFIAHGIHDNKEISGKIETLISLIKESFDPPLSSCLTPNVIIKILRPKSLINSNSLEQEIHQRLREYFMDVLGVDDIKKIFPLMNQVLVNINDNDNKATEKMQLLDYLDKSLNNHTGVIVLGEPLCGKSMLINHAKEKRNAELSFINPRAIDFKELYGDTSNGLLGHVLSNASVNKLSNSSKTPQFNESWIVFDGAIEDSWIDILTLAISPPHRLSFCDGSWMNISNKIRFIFETSDISAAAPSTISQCATIYISKHEVTFEMRVDHFLKEIHDNSILIEPLSNKIIGSNIHSDQLISRIRSFSLFFIPKIREFTEKQNITPTLSFLHYINNYFTLLNSSILEYYCVEANDALTTKHTADELIHDLPHLALFSLFWTFAAPFDDDTRRKIESLILQLIKFSDEYKSIFTFPYRNLSEIFFNTETHQWEKWNSGLSAHLFLSNQNKNIDEASLDLQLTEMTPAHLLIPESSLYPTLYITRTLITQNKNILISGSTDIDKAIISDLCFKSPYAINSLAPTTYLFQKNGTHHLLRSMINSVLPDTKLSHAFSLRKPFLSLIDFDTSTSSSAAELIRFITEHDFKYNTKSFVKEITSNLCFIITTDEKEINPRLAHHTFVIQIPLPETSTQIDTLMKSIKVLWNIDQNVNVIASQLLSLLNESAKYFRFNIKHVFQLIQRVAAVYQNKPPEFLCEAITHESIRVFYDPTHSNHILSKINLVSKQLSTVLKGNFINSNDIADQKILANFDSNQFEEYSIDIDLKSIQKSESTQTKSSLKYTTASPFHLADDNILNDMDPCLRMDVLRLARIVSLPRMHAFILTNLQFLPKQLLEGCQCLIGGEITCKDNNIPLMKCFHDTFLRGGQTKTHQYLLVEVEKLNEEERVLVISLLHNYNVFNLFERGEMLKLLANMYHKGAVDSYGEQTLESQSNYNELASEFLLNCVTYFHWVIADHPPLSFPEFIEFAAAFQPFFATDIALKSYIANQFKQKLIHTNCIAHIDPERFENLLTSIRLDPIFDSVPYTRSYSYSMSFLKLFISKFNELCENLESRTDDFVEIEECSKRLKVFLKDTNTSLTNMKNDLIDVSKEIEESMKQLELLNENTQKQKEQLEKETAILYQEETAANAVKKECESKIAESRSALNSSAQELKNLSTRDISIIKGMNHPPRGVLLIARALLFILGIDKNVKPNETNEELEQKWPSVKKVLNDPTFIPQLIEKSQNPLNQNEMKQLKCICDDENFDPAIVERSSSAAKSICKFIRSLIPYYNALLSFKAKMKEMESVQDHINQLRMKHDEAMNKLNETNIQSISLQSKQADHIQSKSSIEERLKMQQEKISSYNELYEMIDPLFSELKEQKEEYESFASIASIQIIMKMFYHNWASPLLNNQRVELLQKIMKILPKSTVEPLIEFARNKTNIRNDDVRALRHIFIPQSSQNVYQKCRFKYNVSENWLENALMLSSDNKKWAVVEGLSLCPLNFLRQICLAQQFVFISAKSPLFEDEFIDAIRNNKCVLLFDFNFASPHRLLIHVQQCIHNNFPLKIFKKKSIDNHYIVYYSSSRADEIEDKHLCNDLDFLNVDSSFIVYFDIEKLSGQRIVLLDVEMIKLGFEIDNVRERIRFSLFEATNLSIAEKMKTIEISIMNKEEELSQAKKNLTDFILDVNITIFDDPAVQASFETQMRHIKILKQEISTYEKEHSELMMNIGNSGEMANEIVSMFDNNNPDIIRYLWRIFDRAMNSLVSFDLNQLKISILTNYATEFGLIPTMPILLHNLTNHSLLTEPNDEIKSGSFDDVMNSVEKYCPSILFNSQCPSEIVNISKSHRPVVINASESIWIPSLLLFYLQKNSIISSSLDCLSTVISASKNGKKVITFCSSVDEMNHIMPAISFTLSQKFISTDFSFFIIVSDAIVDRFAIHDMCNVIKIEQPVHFGASITTSMQALYTVGQTLKIDNSVISLMSMFDASINMFNRIVHNGSHYSIFDSIVALKFLLFNNSLEIKEIGCYLMNFLYSTEFNVNVRSFIDIWMKIFNGVDLQKKISLPNGQNDLPFMNGHDYTPKQMLFNFDLTKFGFEPHLGDFYKKLLYSKITSTSIESNSNNGTSRNLAEFIDDETHLLKINKKLLNYAINLDVSRVWINEKRKSITHMVAILARREEIEIDVSKKIEHCLEMPEVCDISKLFDPFVFFNIMKTNYSVDNHTELSNIHLFITNETANAKYSQKVTNLFCVGADFIEDKFVKKDGCTKLPTLTLWSGVCNDNQYKDIDLYYSGQKVYTAKIKCDFNFDPSSVFINIATME